MDVIVAVRRILHKADKYQLDAGLCSCQPAINAAEDLDMGKAKLGMMARLASCDF